MGEEKKVFPGKFLKKNPFVLYITVAFIVLANKYSPSTHHGPGTVEGTVSTLRNMTVKTPGQA